MEEKALDAHYAYEFKGIRLDPYRIMQVYKKITHPAHQHAFKKLLRAGESVKPLKQDIREVIMTLERWLEMIEEEEGQAEKEKVAAGFSGKEIVEWMNKPINGNPIDRPFPEIGPRNGGCTPSVFGGFDGGVAFCGGWGSTHEVPAMSKELLSAGTLVGPGPYEKSNIYTTDMGKPPILTSHDPEKTLDLGATNRLKPVEDKAEIPVESDFLRGFDYGTGSKIKTLEDAYDEPVKGAPDEDTMQKFWDDFCKPNRAY